MAVLGRSPHPLGRAAGRKFGIPGLSILAAGLVAAAALLPVVQASRVTSTGHDIRTLETRKADLSASIHLAEADVARLAAGDRVEQRARELGMVPADHRIYVAVDQPSPESGMPARYLNEEVPPAPVTSARPWWKSLLSRLPIP
jgi:hypothetical protein